MKKSIHPQEKTVRISGQHMKLGDSLKEHIETKITSLLGKYYDGYYDGHVTLSKTGAGYSADCLIHLDSGAILQSAQQGDDPRQVFDQAAERLEKRLRRYKSRLTSKRRKQRNYKFHDAHMHHIIQAPPSEEEVDDDFVPNLIVEKSVSFPQISVAEAVLELDLIDNPLLLFYNQTNSQLNIVYRRSDGNVGWVEVK